MLPQDEVGAVTCGHSKVSGFRNCMYQYPATTISNGHSFLCCIHGAVEGRVEVPVGVLESAMKDFLAEKISVELSMLNKLKARVHLARRIELAQHKTKKVKHDRSHDWLKMKYKTLQTIEAYFDEKRHIVDPHTAVGLGAA